MTPVTQRYVLLLAPSANRVYAGQAAALARAELSVCAPFAHDVEQSSISGVSALRFTAEPLDDGQAAAVAGQSSFLALFQEVDDDLLRPVLAPSSDVLDDDLVTIPKYPGKTNEQFTRLLVNVTLAAVRRTVEGRLVVLDPLAGRGTTLSTAWMMGHHAAGVEGDEKALDAYAAFLKTYLRRKRLKHSARVSPVRREGKSLGRRLDAELLLPDGRLDLTFFSGDTRQSAALFGKKRFDAIATDAPYGVVHGSRTDVRSGSGSRDRSAAGLLTAAAPGWAQQLKAGGALGLSWNTLGMPREQLAAVLGAAGLDVLDDGPWRAFSHRVDSSIQRDLIVAVKPLDA